MKKAYLVLGHLFFLTLFYYAWTFYKERMLCYDPAFFSFRIIQSGTFDIELNRWGSAVSQLLPLLFLKSGASLSLFLKSYSVSFIIIYYIIFLIITFVLKNQNAGIALMLTLCLAFRHSFYYSTAELYQGMAICILLWALVTKMNGAQSTKLKRQFFIISVLLIYIVSYYHQLALLAVLFILFFEILNEKRYKDTWLLSIFLISVIWFYIRLKFLTSTEYETGKIPSLDIINEQVKHIRTLPSYTYFLEFARSNLKPLILVLIFAEILILKYKKWPLALFIPCFITAFLLLDFITFYKGESPIMYENYITMLGLIASVSLCGIIKDITNRKWSMAIVACLLAWNLVAIYKCSYPFSNRLNYLQRLTDKGHQFSEKKYLIDQSNFPWAYGWVDWALPFETLLYSSLPGPDSTITVHCAEPINRYDSLLNWKNIFLGPRWTVTWFWSNDLNNNYFHLPSTGYKKLASHQSDSSFNESLFTKENIVIKSNAVVAPYNDTIVIPVHVTNKSGYILSAIPNISNYAKLSYHIYSEKGKLLFFEGYRTVLETDINKESLQAIVVSEKLVRGKYIVEVDFVTEGIRWWSINSRSELIIK